MTEEGSIYYALCKTTGKAYVGQTQNYKVKDGKAYKYGISGRWADHISTAFRKETVTPIANAIQEYGPDDFEITCLESNISNEKLDEREAHWIAVKNTCTPHGYNVMQHSRCKHRHHSTLANHYLPTTTKVRMNPVKKDGIPRLVHMYLEQKEGKSVRLVFGQAKTATFADALAESHEFASVFAENGIEIIEESVDDPISKYKEKIESLGNTIIEKIRIAKFNDLVALYIKTSEGTLRMCFGGKKIAQEEAYTTALAVRNVITEMHAESILLEDTISKSATGGCS